jgi:hypothetical protein
VIQVASHDHPKSRRLPHLYPLLDDTSAVYSEVDEIRTDNGNDSYA